jgi:hypothetical protein
MATLNPMPFGNPREAVRRVNELRERFGRIRRRYERAMRRQKSAHMVLLLCIAALSGALAMWLAMLAGVV